MPEKDQTQPARYRTVRTNLEGVPVFPRRSPISKGLVRLAEESLESVRSNLRQFDDEYGR